MCIRDSSYTELQDNGKYALQGAGVIVDNQSNYVVAIVGGRGSVDQFNRAYLSARQPGSTIKPLIDYGPAFDTGEYSPTRMAVSYTHLDVYKRQKFSRLLPSICSRSRL